MESLNRVGRIVSLHYQSGITDIVGSWYDNDKDKHITTFSRLGSGNELKTLHFNLRGAERDILHDVKALTLNNEDSGDNSENKIISDIASDLISQLPTNKRSCFAWRLTEEDDTIRTIRNSALW
ncbi:hypothetical protein ACJ73_03227 [Blastomyces percursus]|uniref:Uncharacterized protein n=1 Tax=Blastomyces percursus TaxID=1658174 RepID=A0A1J9QBG6_9EURO|nr:hypothetical protein ACJ73_03227 [Blastomyces percursus]